MKNNRGVTLLEILIAISLLTLILFCGGGIYLSGMNLYNDARDATQAYRNAQIVMMHMQKYVKDSATTFSVSEFLQDNGIIRTLQFLTYNVNSPNFSSDPNINVSYTFIKSKKQITFNSNPPAIAIGPEPPDYIFNHISDCVFESTTDKQNNKVVLRVKITAEDNKGKNTYELSSYIQAGLTASPSVHDLG